MTSHTYFNVGQGRISRIRDAPVTVLAFQQFRMDFMAIFQRLLDSRPGKEVIPSKNHPRDYQEAEYAEEDLP